MSRLSDPIILAVDNDPHALSTAKSILNLHDFDVFAVTSAESAVEIARQLEVDLIITDVRVNTLDGVELVSRIRALPDRSDVPAIFTSATQRSDIIRRVHQFGSAYHIKKPYKPNVLTELVDRALWMPHLVHEHLNQPHFSKPSKPLFPQVDIQALGEPFTPADGSFF